MPDQTVKHDNSLPGFLLILLPAAFGAVFLSVAWPFIVGGVVLLTGNSVWQSYQWAKLSQQVNPYFAQMVQERQGEIAPLALSTRANISPAIADRYLQGKAAEIGGVSYRSTSGDNVYSFLTVGALENTFAGLDRNLSISQKLAGSEYTDTVADSEIVTVTSVPVTTEVVVVVQPPITESVVSPEPTVVKIVEAVIPTPVIEPVVSPESAVAKIVAEVAPNPVIEPIVSSEPAVAKIVEEVAPNPVIEPIVSPEPAVAKIVEEVTSTPATKPIVSPEPVESPVQPVTKIAETPDVAGGSDFAQALRSIFNAEHSESSTSDEEEIALEAPASIVETINQSDLAKRLDVHPSTLYKRRSDVSFDEWTRNRDPEGFAWGYQKDTKEFYRIT
jgi:hypothetical protein